MKLLKLYSDNPSFKTINFNPGLNIIAGLQSSDKIKDSVNGIGKSSSLQLLHLLFGGSFEEKSASDKRLREFLSQYGNFYLDFSVGSTKYSIRKNFSESNFYINEEKIAKTAYPKKLNSILNANNNIKFNFKALFNIFARRYLPERNYYSGALTQQGQPSTDYYQILYNITLLGIDTTLIEKNKKLTEEISKLKKTEEILKKQKITINDTNLLDLKDEVLKLTEDKNNFIIAKNYDSLKSSADELTREMNKLRNVIYSVTKEANKKIDLLNASDDKVINLSRVNEIYHEAKFFFPEKITKQLSEAEEFHVKIQESRKSRLRVQIKELIQESTYRRDELNQLEKERDLIIKDLDSKGALEEYNSIVERVRTLESEISELTSYQTCLTKFEKTKAELELQKAKIKTESIIQLEENEEHIQEIESTFRKIVKELYNGHGGSFKITNSKNAQYLYDIEAHIPKDGSQGINEVKIFCYDFLLFKLNPKVLGFIAHDGCIFSGVDPRQITTMFKIIIKNIQENDLQYFVNMNKDVYDMVINDQSKLSEDDKKNIKQGTVLKLYDASPESTLFGYTFD